MSCDSRKREHCGPQGALSTARVRLAALRQSFSPQCSALSGCAYNTQKTCAQTATVARNRLIEANASASSTTERTMSVPYALTLR